MTRTKTCRKNDHCEHPFVELRSPDEVVVFKKTVLWITLRAGFFVCFSLIRWLHARDRWPKKKSLVLSVSAGYMKIPKKVRAIPYVASRQPCSGAGSVRGAWNVRCGLKYRWGMNRRIIQRRVWLNWQSARLVIMTLRDRNPSWAISFFFFLVFRS